MKKAILLSIHPEHVKKIISGEKKFEFRKVKTRKYQPNKIFIYSTPLILVLWLKPILLKF